MCFLDCSSFNSFYYFVYYFILFYYYYFYFIIIIFKIILILFCLLLLLLYSILFIFIFIFPLLSPLSSFLLHLPSPTHFFSLLTIGHHFTFPFQFLLLVFILFWIFYFDFDFFLPQFFPSHSSLSSPKTPFGRPPLHLHFPPISPPISQEGQPQFPRTAAIFFGGPLLLLPLPSLLREAEGAPLFFLGSPPHSWGGPFLFL